MRDLRPDYFRTSFENSNIVDYFLIILNEDMLYQKKKRTRGCGVDFDVEGLQMK